MVSVDLTAMKFLEIRRLSYGLSPSVDIDLPE